MTTVTYTTALTGSQDGYQTSAGGSFVDTGTTMRGIADIGSFGILFDISSQRTMGAGGVFLDPPVIDLSSAYFTVTPTATYGVSFTFNLYFVPEYDPDPFDDTLRPGWPTNGPRRGAILLSTVTTAPTIDTPITFTFDNTTNRDFMLGYIRHSCFVGKIALALQFTASSGAILFCHSSEADNGLEPSITWDESPFFTGIQGAPLGREARAVRCPILGTPYLSDELIPDGYRDGLWVSPRAWDPEDRTGEDFYPPPDEGVDPNSEVI